MWLVFLQHVNIMSFCYLCKYMKTKVILVTGASSGIGLEAARKLSAQGHKVYGAARRTELIPEGVVPVSLDLTSPESVTSAVETVVKAEGRIDILVNNAGYGFFGAIENVPMEDARRQMEVNVFGLALMVKAVAPYMREQRSGRIINVSSVAGKAVLLYGGWYNVSKFSVEALSDALRMELKPFGIDVSIIEPGGIRTPWGGIAADHLEESSRGTAYEKDGLSEANTLRKAYSWNLLSTSNVVARAISRACNSRCPRTRYVVGFGARAILFFHAVLPTRWWDAIARGFARLKV